MEYLRDFFFLIKLLHQCSHHYLLVCDYFKAFHYCLLVDRSTPCEALLPASGCLQRLQPFPVLSSPRPSQIIESSMTVAPARFAM